MNADAKTKSTRVAIYSPYGVSAPGAASMRIRALEQVLIHENCSVRVFTPADGIGLPLMNALAKYSPELIIGTSPPLPQLMWVWAAAKITGARFVVDAKDDGQAISILHKKDNHQKIRTREKVFLQLRKFLYEHADFIWFLTKSDMEEALGRYSINTHRADIVMNGTDSRIVFNAALRKNIRKKWKLKKGMNAILYAGSLGDEDLEGYIRAAAKLPQQKYFFEFAVTYEKSDQKRVGGFELHEFLSKHLTHFHVVDNVPLSEMPAILSGADVGVVPWKDTLPTSIPVKTFDYAGTGLPILAKCPPTGELHKLLMQEKGWGKSVAEWGNIHPILGKLIKTRTSNNVRVRAGAKVHSEWNRSDRVKGAVKRALSALK